MSVKSGGKSAYSQFQRIMSEHDRATKRWEDLDNVQRMAWEAGAQEAVRVLMPTRRGFTDYGDDDKEIED